MIRGKVTKQNMEAKKVISVSCVSDHNYLCGLWVALHSICLYCSAGYTLRFHILDCGLLAEDVQRLKTLETLIDHCKVELCFHTVSLERFKDCPMWRGGYAPYARLLLQDLLADEVFTIYTDIDTLWLRDISELWALRSHDYLLWAVRDGSELPELSSGMNRATHFAKRGITLNPSDYYCSGLIMMNLKRLREIDFSKRIMQVLKDYAADIVFPDQDVYNVLINGKDVYYLDFRWGEFAVVHGRRGGIDLPVVIHYAKSAPWVFKACYATSLWWKYLRDEAGYDVFGPKIGEWKLRTWKALMMYAVRKSRLVRQFFKIVNPRSAAKTATYLFPEKYPLS